MYQQIYWHASLWEVILVVFIGLTIIFLLLYQLLKPVEPSKALRNIHPLLDNQPLFFYSKADGLQELNSAASIMIDNPSASGENFLSTILVDAMSEAITENRQFQQENCPRNDQTLTVIPFSNEDMAGALATVIDAKTQLGISISLDNEEPTSFLIDSSPIPVSRPSDSHYEDSWLPLGRYLLIHPQQPAVSVRQVIADSGVLSKTWSERQLTHSEEMLLRHLLHNLNKTQSSESLFQAIWIDDEVDSVGLRPDQKDRLRRLIFQLRQRIEPDPRNPKYLQTAHGVGYTLYEKSLHEAEL